MKKSSIKENHLLSEKSGVLSAKKGKGGVKLMSITGLLPVLYLAAATGGDSLTVLWIAVGIVAALGVAIFIFEFIRIRKGVYDKKEENEDNAVEEAKAEEPAQQVEEIKEPVEEKPVEEEPAPVVVAAEEVKEEAPAEEVVDELVPEEEGMEIIETKVNADGDTIVVEKDAKGNIFEIRFVKSFTAKIIQANDEGKKYYEELKNEVLSYKKVNSRVSWHYDSANSGRKQFVKFGVRGKTLCVYFPLNADDYADSKYKVEKVESKKYEEVPCLYRIKNDRRCGYAKELIAVVAEKLGLEKGEQKNESYVLPYEDNKPLIARGLIKELKVQVSKPAEVPAPAPVEEEEANDKAFEELAKEEGMEIVESKVNNDGDAVLVEKDAKGNIFEIRFIKSFTAKLSQADDVMKDYYTVLKNYVLAYNKANSRVSWHYDAVNVGRNMAIKFAVRGKTLCVYYNLNKEILDDKYKVEDAKGKKYEDVPVLYRIKNDRRCEYAKDLIDMVMANLGVEKGEIPNEDYHIPYEETLTLLKKGLIKEQKVRINKPAPVAVEEEPKEEVDESSYQELAKEEGMEIVESKVNNDGDVVLVEKDAKGNIFEIRFIKSFTAKLSQADDVMKDYYTVLKNYALAHKKANSRVSWHYDAVNVGRNMVLKFAVRGKTLCVYYNLVRDELDPKYKVEPAKGKKYEDVPVLYRIKNDRRCEYAKDLIDMAMREAGSEKGEIPNEDYRIPYEETIPLLKKGLIKELKVRVNKPEEVVKEEPAPVVKNEPVTPHMESITVEKAEEMMTDEAAEEAIVIKKAKIAHSGKKEVINIDILSKNFEDGDVVDIEALRAKKLVSNKADYVKVLARGVLTKQLTVNADDFSIQAVKMIVLMGGKVNEYK
ncbi:MAG: uL15 family ribosomal protein [Bacilli bacterium]|nr:uL15 family ribosomal protein [Bacilli bacterium]